MPIKNITRMTELWMKTKCSNADIRMCSRFTVEYMFTWSQEDSHSKTQTRPLKTPAWNKTRPLQA